jgi:hypothetical protein
MTTSTGAEPPCTAKTNRRIEQTGERGTSRTIARIGPFRVLLRQWLPRVRVATAKVLGRCRNGIPLLEGSTP